LYFHPQIVDIIVVSTVKLNRDPILGFELRIKLYGLMLYGALGPSLNGHVMLSASFETPV
jgi:hypothetical protein